MVTWFITKRWIVVNCELWKKTIVHCQDWMTCQWLHFHVRQNTQTSSQVLTCSSPGSRNCLVCWKSMPEVCPKLPGRHKYPGQPGLPSSPSGCPPHATSCTYRNGLSFRGSWWSYLWRTGPSRRHRCSLRAMRFNTAHTWSLGHPHKFSHLTGVHTRF